MLNWFRSLLLGRVYRNLMRSTDLKDKGKFTKRIKSISVILDQRLGIDKEHFKKMAEIFGVSRANVRVLTYYQSPGQISEEYINSSYTYKDISNFGKVNGVLSDFCSKSTDVLINYYEENDINLKYISSKCKRNMSIGFTKVDLELNDLIIDVNAESIDLFTKECVKYLKTIYS